MGNAAFAQPQLVNLGPAQSLAPTSDIKRLPVNHLLAGIRAANDEEQSRTAGRKLIAEAKRYGLNMREYLQLAVDPRAGVIDDQGKPGEYNPFYLGDGQFLDGYEATLAYLNLPVRDDFRNGVTLQAASDSFAMSTGARALFPEVIDDMVKWAYRQDQFESTAGLVSQSRTISGVELVSMVVDDDSGALGTHTVAEFGQIPVYTITTSETSVKMYKHGNAIRTSYEFERRNRMDLLRPYAARVVRNLEISKVTSALNVLINGDGVNGAATAANITTYGADLSGKTLKDNYQALMKFLVQRSQSGLPVDTIVGNLDAYIELFLMFTPINVNTSVAEHLQAHGAPKVDLTLPVMQGVKFKLASGMPAGKLLCYSLSDTLEELQEAGARISESETAIRNQTYFYQNTEVTGYKLIYGDTRTYLDFTA